MLALWASIKIPHRQEDARLKRLEKKRVIELRRKAQAMRATLSIGKTGASEAVLLELTKQLNKRKLVKIKLLQSVADERHAMATKLAKETSSVLIETRGKTVVLAKE